MGKNGVGTLASQTSPGRWPFGLSSAAQLLGEVGVGIIGGAPGVLAFRSVLIAAEQRGVMGLPWPSNSPAVTTRRSGRRVLRPSKRFELK